MEEIIFLFLPFLALALWFVVQDQRCEECGSLMTETRTEKFVCTPVGGTDFQTKKRVCLLCRH